VLVENEEERPQGSDIQGLSAVPNPVIRSHYGNGFIKQYVRDLCRSLLQAGQERYFGHLTYHLATA
jgi:hypothetical protein